MLDILQASMDGATKTKIVCAAYLNFIAPTTAFRAG